MFLSIASAIMSIKLMFDGEYLYAILLYIVPSTYLSMFLDSYSKTVDRVIYLSLFVSFAIPITYSIVYRHTDITRSYRDIATDKIYTIAENRYKNSVYHINDTVIIKVVDYPEGHILLTRPYNELQLKYLKKLFCTFIAPNFLPKMSRNNLLIDSIFAFYIRANSVAFSSEPIQNITQTEDSPTQHFLHYGVGNNIYYFEK